MVAQDVTKRERINDVGTKLEALRQELSGKNSDAELEEKLDDVSSKTIDEPKENSKK